VTLVEGPLAAGHPAGAPYDLVLIDGAIEQLPDALLGQVADGGRIATGFMEQGVTRLAIGRVIGGAIGFITFADAAIAPLPGFSAPRGFSF
jgi:protein-L-isoaspartate(D-aspartate) O-methyltransferase